MTCVHTDLPLQVTQLGHVKDLASAFTKVIGNSKAHNQVQGPGIHLLSWDAPVEQSTDLLKTCKQVLRHWTVRRLQASGSKMDKL